MSRQDRFSWFFARSPWSLGRQPRRLKSASRAPGRGFALGRRLHVEPLEDRRMLAVIMVTSSADDLALDGLVTLREAIQAANADTSVDGSTTGSGADTIHFDAALSGQAITLGGTDLEITEALTIDATSLANNVTIDANLQSRIFNITATTGDFTLAGLTITGGRTTGSNGSFENTTFSGGAIRSLTTGNVAIEQSIVSGSNTEGAWAYGGGIFSSDDVTLASSSVSGNSSVGSGGGIHARGGGVVTLTNSSVSGNTALGISSNGGGISAFGVTLINSTVSGNRTLGGDGGFAGTGYLGKGGGIIAYNVSLTNSTVSGNSTRGEYGYGGGIATYGTVTLTNSTVSGNSTTGEASNGGGIWALSDVTLTNSTVSGNRTTFGDGGGIWARAAVTFTSSTVTDNHAGFFSEGGGIWNNGNNHFAFTITNSIVAGNTASGSPDIRPGAGILDIDFSLIGTAVTPDPGGTGNLFDDTPLLGLLADNGGPTETHAMLATSPALNAGNPSIAFNPAEFDQRGMPFLRVANARIDIGAYEVQVIASSADFDADGDIDGADFLAWQRGFGTPSADKPDGDADNDNDVDAADLVVWSNQFGQPAPVAAVTAPLASEPIAEVQLIDAVMAIELTRSVDADESLMVDEEPASVETFSGHFFAAEAIARAVVFADENEPPDSDSREGEETENPWLADELLERVFG